jgi:MFS family permease
LLLPYSLIGPFVGVLLDRWSRRSVLILANLVRAGAMLLISAVVSRHTADSSLALLVLVTLGVNRFLQAALAASIPHVVAEHQLTRANALFPTLGTTGSAFAVGLGLLVQSRLGNTDQTNSQLILLGLVLATFAAFTASRITPSLALGPDDEQRTTKLEMTSALSALAHGWRALLAAPQALKIMFATALQRFAFGALTLNALLLAREVWHTQAEVDIALRDFGICATAAALGAFSASMVGAYLNERLNLPRIASWLSVGVTGFLAMALLYPTLGSIAVGALLTAFTGQLLKISADTAVQHHIDDAHRGRAFSIFDVIINIAIVSGVSLAALVPYIRNTPAANVYLIGTLLLSAGVLARKSTN